MESKFFDLPLSPNKADDLIEKLIASNWQIDKKRWTEYETKDFYKGMYAMIRVAQSLNDAVDKNTVRDMLSKIGLDILFIMHKK